MQRLSVLAASLALAVAALGGAAPVSGSRDVGPPSGLTPQGQLLWNFEALLRETFNRPVVSASMGLNDSLNFSCAGWCGPNAKYLHYKFTFAPNRGSTLHVSKRRYIGGSWGVYPRGILIRGHLVACNAEENRFLISWVFTSMASFTLGCDGDPLGGHGNRRLSDGSWYGKIVGVRVAQRTLTFAPACRISESGRWVSASHAPSAVALTPRAALAIYYRPDGSAAAGHSQPTDWKDLADVAAHGRLPDFPPGWFITLKDRAAASIEEDSGISSSGTADRRRFACVWSRATRAFVSTRADPPLLVPWSRVGDMALGESRASVERDYGSAGHGFHVLSQGNGIVQGYYRLHRSRVFVTFEDGRVNELDFTTRYYRTKSGFGVGSRIPLGPCHRTATNRCEHRWHGFVWNAWVREKPCNCWVKVGLGARSLPATAANFRKPWFFIYTSGGRVIHFHFALKFVD